MMDWSAFFVVHSDLPREGPGLPEDIAWACALADLPPGASICDVGCGPGGDLGALLTEAPEGRVTGLEKRQAFVDAARLRFADEARATVEVCDMVKTPDHAQAPFDMIWSAGALYFLGLQDGLATMARALKPGGVIAFSEPCLFDETPSDEARGFWGGYEASRPGGIVAAMAQAGFTPLGQRKVTDAGWEAYYQPMEARIAHLRDGADAPLTQMLDLCAKEATDWRQVRDQTGYMLSVGRLG